jgi:hypothetical protein
VPYFLTSPPSPQVMHGEWERRPKIARVLRAHRFCALPTAACAAAVRAVAPIDHRLYDLAKELFDAQWRREFGRAPGGAPEATKVAEAAPAAPTWAEQGGHSPLRPRMLRRKAAQQRGERGERRDRAVRSGHARPEP